MPGILSQNEIDELLSALAAGEDTPTHTDEEEELGQVKEYDFRTANKFPKEQMRMLQFIYENFAGRLSSYFSGTLRVMSEVEVVSIEEQSFQEFSNSIPSPVVLSVIGMSPLKGSALLEISPAIAYEIVSRLFGGTGEYVDIEKAFTEIELSVLRRIILQILEVMGEAWEKAIAIRPSLDRMETSAQFTQIVSSNEPIVIITMNVTIGQVSDIINLCIPHVAVQPVFKQLSMRVLYADSFFQEDAKEDVGKINPDMADIVLTLHAAFDDTIGTVNDIISLQVGDVIRVDHPTNKPINVTVEHMPKFKAAIGTKGSKYAVRITDILKEENDHE